ncbi:hypothetical protein QNN88_10195 [Citrobacter sp. ANG330]|uniref:hypothetical protein n=1 Tax=Citrobacter sp. ANG330 TaxID=3048142 RepID=UPI0039C154B8
MDNFTPKRIGGNLSVNAELLARDKNGEYRLEFISRINKALEKQHTFPAEHRDALARALLSTARVIDNMSQKNFPSR